VPMLAELGISSGSRSGSGRGRSSASTGGRRLPWRREARSSSGPAIAQGSERGSALRIGRALLSQPVWGSPRPRNGGRRACLIRWILQTSRTLLAASPFAVDSILEDADFVSPVAMNDVRLWHGLWHWPSERHDGCGQVLETSVIFGFPERFAQQKTPRLGRGVSGVTTGRRDMYLYICGSVGGRWTLVCRGRQSWEATGAIERRRAQPRSFFVLLCIVNLARIL